ncbi:hypothetical protein [Candidimonas nitroreducens]|uniref:hypothetical protein n=1 Tax=Candidimonas nitroreducens TaxID=683354 RepID=UPI0013034244|nr:hypothetical protein [Candidimonas nitroreducens]
MTRSYVLHSMPDTDPQSKKQGCCFALPHCLYCLRLYALLFLIANPYNRELAGRAA